MPTFTLRSIVAGLLSALLFVTAGTAHADDGTWNKTAAGPFNWSDAANWNGGAVADGAGFTANFTPNITATQTVTVDVARTIGNITFTDSTTSSHNLTIGGGNALTLDVSSGASVIDVTQSGRTLTISAPVTVNDGLQKNGAGALTFSGPITLAAAQTWTNNSAGTLTTGNGTNLIDNAGSQLTVDGAGTTTFGVINNAAVALTGSGALVKNGSGRLNVGGINSGFTGAVTINGGVLHMHNDAGALGNGNLTINSGVLSAYWGINYNRTLGTGANQVQILGGESGFAGSGTTGPTVNLGATVVWGASGEGTATGYFNPSKFILGDPGTGNAAATTFSSGIDLNGATRTILVPKGNNAGGNRSTISGAISNSTGTAGLIKEGDGVLILSNNSSAWNGNTTVSAGILDFAGNSLASIGGGMGVRDITVAAGAGVRFNALSNALLNRIVETNDEIGVMTGATANNLDFSSSTGANLPNAFLGNWAGNGAKAEYSGILTPASDNYRLGAKGSSGLLGIVGANKLTGSQGLIVGGTGASGIRVNLAAAQDFTGDTVINTGAKLTIGNNLALQNSTLDVGSAGGNFALAAGTNSGRITGETASASPTFGGLKGSRNLLSVFTNAASNNETNLAATAVTGFTLNPGTGKSVTYSGVIADFAVGTTITKTGAGTQILTGVNTYTGATTVNAGTLVISGSPTGTGAVNVNGGTLTLDYSTNDTSKIHDAAVLTLGGGTLDLSGGTHTEVVGSTTVNLGYSTVSRSSGNATLVLGAITPNPGGAVNFSAANIATTTNANDATGILGHWAIIAGADWAMNDGAGNIVAYTAYTDVSRLTPGAIASNAASNVRLVEGSGAPGNITMASAGTTTINTLLQSASGGASPASIAIGDGNVLQVNSILLAPTAGALTINASGTLQSATAGGLLGIANNNPASTVTVNAAVTDNTFASALGIVGNVALTATNTYTGLTGIAAEGSLTVGGAGQLGSGSYAGAIVNDGSLVYSSSADQVLSGAINGIGSLTKANSSTLTLTGANTYSGGTTVNAGTLIAQTTGASTNSLGIGAVSIASVATLRIDNLQTSGATAIGNAFTGSGRLIVNFAADTVARNTTLNNVAGFNGTIELANAGINADKWNLTSAGVNAPGATVQINSGSTLYFPGGVSTFAGIILSGIGNSEDRGALRFGNGGTLNGPVTVGGDSTIGTDGSATSTVNGNISASGAYGLTVGTTNATGTTNLNGILGNGSGTLALTNAAGTLNLNAANTYTGVTTINGGTLTVGHVSGLGSTSAITMADGTTLRSSLDGVSMSAPITVGAAGTTASISAPTNAPGAGLVSTLALAGAIGGDGNVTFTSSVNQNALSTVLLNAQSNYAGSTLLDTTGAYAATQIILKLGINDALPKTTVLTIDGRNGTGTGRFAELNLNGFSQEIAGLTNVARTSRVQRVVNSDVSAPATLTVKNAADHTFSGILGGSANGSVSTTAMPGSTNGNNFSLIKDGAGVWTISGANTYAGSTRILGGILNLGNSLAMQNSALDTLNSVAGDATNGLRTTVTTLTMGGLTGNKDLASVFTTSSGGYDTVTALTLNPGTGVTNSYSGVIADGAAGMNLTKTGAGTQVLGGANTYTGATAVNEGTLLVNGSLAAASAVAVNATGTLGGTGTINGPVTVNDGGTLAPGASAGQITLASGLNMSAAGTGANMVWELAALSTSNPGTDFDFVSLTGGDLALGGQSKLTLDFNLLDFALRPDQGSPNAFWTSNRSWKILDTTSNAGGTNFVTLANGVFTAGTFTTVVGANADVGDIFLNYTAAAVGPVTRTWTGLAADGGLWATGANWSDNTAPVAGQMAKFAGAAPGAVTIQDGKTVGQVLFDSAASYTVSGDTGATLTMDNTGGTGSAAITAAAGSHTISAQVATAAASPLDLSISTGASLNLAGGIANDASVVNVTGGTVSVAAIDGAGDTAVGTGSAATLITAHIRQDTLTINADSKVTINATGASGTSVVNFLQISSGTGFTWGDGDGFVPAGASAASGVNAVPEPSAWALLGLGLLSLLAFRRRR